MTTQPRKKYSYPRNKEREQMYYRLNKEKHNRRAKEWAQKHPEQVAQRCKRWRTENPEQFRESLRRYKSKNPEFVKAITVKWRAEHAEHIKAYRRKYHLANREKIAAAGKQSRLKNPNRQKVWGAKNKAKVNQYQQKRRARKAGNYTDDTAKIFYLFVRRKKRIPCYYCGTIMSGKDAHIDHIVAVSKNGNHSSENLCASCKPCNSRKHDKSLSEWPHKGQALLNL